MSRADPQRSASARVVDRLRDDPIEDDELDGLFADFLMHDRILLAVSGGRDSLALLLLAARWLRTRRAERVDRPELVATTINHGLRQEAIAEAEFVAEHCASLSVPHVIHHATVTPPGSGLQEWARDTRYSALHAIALETNCTAIATGHQAEDQAETLLMRLARGSGLNGLAAMETTRALGDLRLLRPLLATPRARLSATLRANEMNWIDDPSNLDSRFERTAFQTHATSLEALGLTAAALGKSSRRLRGAVETMEWATKQALDQMPSCRNALATAVYGVLPRAVYDAFPFELRVRILRYIMDRVRGETKQVHIDRLDRVETLVRDLELTTTQDQPTLTIGGCLITAKNDMLYVCREPGRNGFPVLQLHANIAAHWDNRFIVSAPVEFNDRIQVRALSDSPAGATRHIDQHSLQALPKAARDAIPAFWDGATLLAVPQIGHVAAGFRTIVTMQDKLSDMPHNAAVGSQKVFMAVPKPV